MTAPYPPVDGTQPCATDPEAFFPHPGLENSLAQGAGPASPGWRKAAPGTRQGYWAVTRALELCEACPFRRPCLAYALTTDVIGIWGGTTHAVRRHIRTEHGITAEPVHFPDPTGQRDLDVAARDAEVARLDALGLTATQIAERLGISNQTVHTARVRNQQSEGATA